MIGGVLEGVIEVIVGCGVGEGGCSVSTTSGCYMVDSSIDTWQR